MKIIWDQVTRSSQLVAIVLFVAVFFVGLCLGKKSGIHAVVGPEIDRAVFQCDAGKSIEATFYKLAVHVDLGDSEKLFLTQTISGSGARYVNKDGTLVFWNKGTEGLVMRNNEMDMAYANCKT